MESEEVVELEGKRFILHKAPATVAYEVAIKMREANKDPKVVVDSLYTLIKYVEVDLGDGRKPKLDNLTFLNQQLTDAKSLATIQAKLFEINYGFLASGEDSNSCKTQKADSPLHTNTKTSCQ